MYSVRAFFDHMYIFSLEAPFLTASSSRYLRWKSTFGCTDFMHGRSLVSVIGNDDDDDEDGDDDDSGRSTSRHLFH